MRISKAVARGGQPGQGPADDRRKGKRAARIRGTDAEACAGNGLPGTRHFQDAVPILAAMRAVPFERRMDAVAVACDAFIRTGGHLTTERTR